MIKNIYEILQEVGEAASESDASLVLHYNQSYALKSVLKAMLHPQIKFLITSIPQYVKSDAPPGLAHNTIHTEIGRAYLFLEGHPAAMKLTPKRREEILIQILESMESREAEVYGNMLLKNPSAYKNLTPEVVRKAFPDILPA